MGLRVVPITFKAAKEYIKVHHRHLKNVVGTKFCIAVQDEVGLRGVAVVGRPVARGADDGFTVEVNRCCTDGTANACSMLYGAARRVAKELGYKKILTYTLSSESGSSLRAAGWVKTKRVPGRSWSCPSRPREDKAEIIDKIRWEAELR